MPPPSQTTSHFPALGLHLVFVAVVAAVSFIRWRLLSGTAYPTGLDGGNWLAFGHSILGEHLRSSSIVYPPIVPLIAVASEWLFGTYGGIQALAFGAAATPAFGMYILLYAWGLRWGAVILAGFLAASASTGEAMAWGGYPQLIGLGVLPLFVFALERFLVGRTLWRAFPPALLLLTALATSDLVGPITVLVGLLYLPARYAALLMKREGNSRRNVLLGIGLSIVLASPMLPTYVGLATGAAANEQTKLAGHSSIMVAVTSFNAVAQDLPLFWLAALVAAVASPLVVIVRRDHRLAVFSVSILWPLIALLVFVGERRFANLLPVGIVAGLGAWWVALERVPNWSRLSVNAALITCLLIDVLIGTQYYATQRNYYAVLNPGLVQGLAELSSLSRPQQLIAVSPAPNDWELGWWVEGVAHRPAIYAGSPMWLNYADEKARNAIANRIFSSENDFELTQLEARDAGAKYLFVDKEWSTYQIWASHGLRDHPGSIVYENESVLIIASSG